MITDETVRRPYFKKIGMKIVCVGGFCREWRLGLFAESKKLLGKL